MEHDELFEGSLSDFRPREWRVESEYLEKNQCTGSGFLLLDFDLPEPITHDLFEIEKSINVGVTNIKSAFIAPVRQLVRSRAEEENLYWGEPHFSMGLSSIVSLITSRAVRASTDKITNKNVDREGIRAADAAKSGSFLPMTLESLAGFDLTRLAVQHAVIVNESPYYSVSRATRERWVAEILEMANLLFQIPYEDYVVVMRAARLVQHAHLNRADDTGLAYYFLVSAIEAVSSVAAKKLPKKIKGQKGDRFAKFICEFCERDTWEQLEYPEEEFTRYTNEQSYRKLRPEGLEDLPEIPDLPLQRRADEPDPFEDDSEYAKYEELYRWHELTTEAREKLKQTLKNPHKILLGAPKYTTKAENSGPGQAFWLPSW